VVNCDKIAAVRDLAKGRQALADVKANAAQKLAELERDNAERIGATERDDVRLYSAATKAGWSADELRKIGFDAPAKSRRVARKRSSAARSSVAPMAPGRLRRHRRTSSSLTRAGAGSLPPMPGSSLHDPDRSRGFRGISSLAALSPVFHGPLDHPDPC